MNQEDFERYWTEYYPLVRFIAKKAVRGSGKSQKTNGDICTRYVRICIEGKIRDFLRKFDVLTQRERKMVNKYKKFAKKFVKKNKREPTVEEVANGLGLTIDEVSRIMRTGYRCKYLFGIIGWR